MAGRQLGSTTRLVIIDVITEAYISVWNEILWVTNYLPTGTIVWALMKGSLGSV